MLSLICCCVVCFTRKLIVHTENCETYYAWILITKLLRGRVNSFWELASVQITQHEELQNLKKTRNGVNKSVFRKQTGKANTGANANNAKKKNQKKQQHLEVMCDNSHSYCFRFSEQSWSMQTFFDQIKNLASHLNTYSVSFPGIPTQLPTLDLIPISRTDSQLTCNSTVKTWMINASFQL